MNLEIPEGAYLPADPQVIDERLDADEEWARGLSPKQLTDIAGYFQRHEDAKVVSRW